MNKMKWGAIAVSAVLILVLTLGVSRHHSMAVGPMVETAPGIYAQDFVDATVPVWVVLTSATLFGLAVVFFYRGLKQRKL